MPETGYAALQTALSTSLTDLVTNLMGTAAIVIPLALTVWGAVLGIGYAKKFFRTMSK